MTLSDRFRNAAAGTPGPTPRASGPPPDAPGSRTPGRPEHPAGLPGAPPRTRRTGRRRRGDRLGDPAGQSPTLYRCPACGQNHQPIPMGGGLADAYSRTILPDPTRADPIGRGRADTSCLVRDGFNPWRAHPVELPPAPGTGTLRERIARLWYGDEA
jgi:hypothetical protein